MVSQGQKLWVLKPRYDPRDATADDNGDGTTSVSEHTHPITVGQLYVPMGRNVLPVDSVPAGNLAGIAGLQDFILKSATLSSTLACPAFRPLNLVASPIVHVAVEPLHPSDMPALLSGLKLLNQSDPCVEVVVQETGECVLSTAGEIHLQRCLDDLRKRYSRVELRVSSPIVPFRETIVPPPKVDMVNEAISSENEVVGGGGGGGGGGGTRPLVSGNLENEGNGSAPSDGVVTIQTTNRTCTLQIRARPLPGAVVSLLEENVHLLKALNLLATGPGGRTAAGGKVALNEETVAELQALKTKLGSAFEDTSDESSWWDSSDSDSVGGGGSKVVDEIWSFGPRHVGPNILLNGVEGYRRASVWSALEGSSSVAGSSSTNAAGDDDDNDLLLGKQPTITREYDNSIVSGFQLASLSGPLCEEPMHGVCLVLCKWTHSTDQRRRKKDGGGDESLVSGSSSQAKEEEGKHRECGSDVYGPFSGQLISAMKEGCRRAFLVQPARLMAAMYTCDILATADVLGKLYSVLGRRSGRICSEEMKEGSAVFSVKALVPVAESFGFAEEVRKKTSGLANPQLFFSHWEVSVI